MKKIIATFIVLILIFSLTLSAYAYEEQEYSVVYTSSEPLGDGYTLEVTVTQGQPIRTYGLTTYRVDGYKTMKISNSDGDLEWSARLYGLFEYTNFNCSCIDSNITYTIYNNKWRISSATSTESGNKAIGYVTAKYYVLGVNTKTLNETITLTCSATGVLS